MVKPVSLKGFQKGFQGVSLRGLRGFQIFLWELCVCIKYLSLGDPAIEDGGFPMHAVELLALRHRRIEPRRNSMLLVPPKEGLHFSAV